MRKECASLTKIMTALVIIKLCQQLELVMEEEEVAISYSDTRIIGTSANLREGDILTVD